MKSALVNASLWQTVRNFDLLEMTAFNFRGKMVKS